MTSHHSILALTQPRMVFKITSPGAASSKDARCCCCCCRRANQVQTGGYCLPSSSQHCNSISVEHAETRCRHPITQSSLVVDFQPLRCPPITPSYCRGTLACFSWSETLEQSCGRYYYGRITTSVSKKTENLPISAIIPGHYTVVSDCFRHGGYFLL